MGLCNDFMGISLLLFWIMWCSFKRNMWYKIIQNFNSLRCLVLEISSIEFDNHRGFRASAGVHKLFEGRVSRKDAFWKWLDFYWHWNIHRYIFSSRDRFVYASSQLETTLFLSSFYMENIYWIPQIAFYGRCYVHTVQRRQVKGCFNQYF